jgi:hypothetical protein
MQRLFALAAASLALFHAPAFASQKDTWPAPQRVVAVGDVHGGFNKLTEVLRQARLIDNTNRWIGGTAHLVQTGDVVDRGPDSKLAMELLMRLERDAEAAGGRVHALIGNHEILDVLGDLRYVSMKEFGAFEEDEKKLTEAQYQELYERYRGVLGPKKSLKSFKGYCRMTTTAKGHTYWGKLARGDLKGVEIEKPEKSVCPPGYWGHRWAFSPKGKYGKWIMEHNLVEKVGGSIFMHGGISPNYANRTLTELNDRATQALVTFKPDERVLRSAGPAWFRCLDPQYMIEAKHCTPTSKDLNDAEATLRSSAHLAALLRNYGVSRIVSGHSIQQVGAIRAHASGRVVLLDVGLSPVIKDGPPTALIIENDNALFALHNGQKLALPADDQAASQLAYLRAVSAAGRPPKEEMQQELATAIARYQELDEQEKEQQKQQAQARREQGRKNLKTAGIHPVPVAEVDEDAEEEKAFDQPPPGNLNEPEPTQGAKTTEDVPQKEAPQ